MRLTVTGGTCPNCRYHVDIRDAPWTSGDRVLVAKSLYESGLMHPERDDVVVFKYPQAPQKNHVPMNYIKRLIGLGGETIGIWYGKLYVMYGDEPDESDRKAPPHDLWKPQFMHENKFKEALENRDPRFQIIRKRPDKILALKRLVYKNDNPASDMADFPRWSGPGWSADNAHGFHHDAAQGPSLEWLRYSHLLRGSGDRGGPPRPELITDFMGYNSWETDHGHSSPAPNWVGDLMLECDVAVDQPAGLLVLELAKGVDRFRARFELADGSCTLVRVRDGVEQKLETKPTSLKQKGTYRVRFANVDERLTVWVDSSLPFGDGVAYEAATERGPRENDLQPANIGVQGAAVGVHHLTLWRDTYYTLRPGDADATVSDWSDPSTWGELLHLPAKTLFVQPGHYLCLGDNSPESSDSRAWGTVPERLLLGRALLVYYPFYAPFWPLQSPVNRVGPIE
jgi:signal peptidase I